MFTWHWMKGSYRCRHFSVSYRVINYNTWLQGLWTQAGEQISEGLTWQTWSNNHTPVKSLVQWEKFNLIPLSNVTVKLGDPSWAQAEAKFTALPTQTARASQHLCREAWQHCVAWKMWTEMPRNHHLRRTWKLLLVLRDQSRWILCKNGDGFQFLSSSVNKSVLC